MKTHMAGSAIELDGEGSGVPMAEIERVRALFRELFRAEPVLRMTGLFDGDAVAPGSERDAWDLRYGTEGGWVPVVHVGPEFVQVLFPTGVNRGRSVTLAPELGRLVRVRLAVPKTT